MGRKVTATVTVTVNDQAWTRVSDLRKAGPDDPVYELDLESGKVTFGDIWDRDDPAARFPS